MSAERIFITPGEAIIASLTLGFAATDAALILRTGVAMDAPGYWASGATGAALLALAALYRWLARSYEIADAAAFAGWFVLFTAALSTFNYLMLPIRVAPIDPFLLNIDAALGWRWSDMVAWGARHPTVSELLAAVYASSLIQIALLTVGLALSGARSELRRMSGTLGISACVCVAIWSVMPSFGPATLVSIPNDVLALARPSIDPAFGAELLRLAAHGIDQLSLGRAEGLIAFPSFHTVLAAICIWSSRGNRWLRLILWPLNILMVPAILLHGGHHLVDLPAGLMVFALSAALSSRHAVRSADFTVSRREPEPQPVP